MNCPRCKWANTFDGRVCYHCGFHITINKNLLKMICSKCGNNTYDGRVCANCGYRGTQVSFKNLTKVFYTTLFL
jgi:ribosomal protein L37E